VQQDWATRLSDQAIRSTVSASTYHLGAAYARQGRVSQLSIDPSGRVLFATVRGRRPSPYSTVVTGAGAPSRWSGRCSCPMGAACKHVAAVMIAAQEALGVAGTGNGTAASWERSVADLVRAPDDGQEVGAGIPLALQLEVVTAPPHGSRARLRPVVPGRNGAWIRTGISWRDLQYDFGRVSHVRAHRTALREMYLAHEARSRSSYYSYADSPVYLDDFGPGLWRLLEHLADAGVLLVPVKATAGHVTVAATPAGVSLDLTRAAGDGHASLRPVLTIGDTALDPATVTFLGDPAHGVLVDTTRTPVPPEVAPAPGLLLAPLRERTTERLSRLLRDARSLDIPAAHLERFLNEYYPGLRQVVTVTSSDATVPLPEIAPPKLALHVRYDPEHRVALRWSFAYPVGDDVRHAPLRGPAGAGAVRDLAAERHLVRGLTLPDDRLPQLREQTAERLPVAEVELSGMDAVFFTEDVLPDLRTRDDVLVDVAGTPPEYRLSDSAPLVRVSATDSSGDADWFDLGVTVSVDGEDIPFADLFVALAREDSHLILASGTYFSIRRPELEQLRRLIEEARALQDRASDGLRISRYQAGLWQELTELGVVEAQSESWGRSVEGLLRLGDMTPAPLPSGLAADLRPYQAEGYQWLSFLWERRLGGILADDMGLGKTVQTLAMICRAHERGELTDPVLVVAPTSVVPNWSQEAARFAPGLVVVPVTETQGRRATSLAEHVDGAHVVVTSYALFRIDCEAYQALPWSGLVLDEAQFVKNHQAKTYQCARRLPAPFKIAITGTPLENSLMDLWSLLSIVAPGLFPSPQRFSELYRTPIERGTDPERLGTLRRRIRPLMRRRTKEQVAAELPPKQEQVLEVALNPRHSKIYQTHLQRERQKVLGLLDDMDRNRFAIFRSLTLLRQLSLDPALVDARYAGVRSSKVDAFFEQLSEVIGEGHRALVFSQFTGFLRTVRDRLDAEGVSYAYLDGRTRDRGRRIEEFKTGDAPVFLVSLKAGGFGLNLTEADYCFVLDPWWNPAVEAQAVDRTHRIGQDKTVMVYRLVASDTIEEKVMELKARKADLFARVMDDDALLSTPLTPDDIRGLLAP
jgi:superfamily II DNA or RNA helicase